MGANLILSIKIFFSETLVVIYRINLLKVDGSTSHLTKFKDIS